MGIPRGSRREVPDSTAAKAAALRRSKLFPEVTPTVTDQFLRLKKKAETTNDLNIFRRRRLMRQEQENARIEYDRLNLELRENRMPGLRGENARMAGLRRTIDELNAQLQ